MALLGMIECVCCKRSMQRNACVLFKAKNNDFENLFVQEKLSCYLGKESNKLCICKTCHSNVRKKCSSGPKIPRLLKAKEKKKITAAEKFLNAIEKKPEFVCTCCHRWLFKKGVCKFHAEDYNFSNKIVAEALSEKHRFQMNFFQNLSSEQESCNDSTTNIVPEYICITCKKWLCRKTPKMPAQAVANCLELTPIPPELLNLNDLEWRLISLRIPF